MDFVTQYFEICIIHFEGSFVFDVAFFSSSEFVAFKKSWDGNLMAEFRWIKNVMSLSCSSHNGIH